MKKIFALFAALLVAFAIVPAASAASATASGTIVILVSNNPADLAVANDLKLMIGDNAVIVQTDWGVFDDTVLEQIEEMSPTEVIILGGHAAVPDAYIEALEADGYTTVRLGGCNQYETLKEAIEWAVENGYTYDGQVYIVDGSNYAEIQELSSQGYFVIFDNGHMDVSEKIVDMLHPKTVTVDPKLQTVMEKLQNQYQVQVQELNKKQLLEQIMEQIKEEMLMDNQTVKARATIELELMTKLMNENKIDLALQLHASSSMAPVVENAANMEKIRERNEYMFKLHEMVRELKKCGKYKDYEQVMREAKLLIKEGKYEEAMKLMEQVQEQAGITTSTESTSMMTSTMSSMTSMTTMTSSIMPTTTSTETSISTTTTSTRRG